MRDRVNLEQVVGVLAAQCDGARRRDGRGFSRADAQEGARLAALASAGIPWSASDARRAMDMAARHPLQASELIGNGNEKFVSGFSAALKSGRVTPKTVVPDGSQPSYNLAVSSPGGRMVYMWRLGWVENLAALGRDLKEITRLRHGVRPVIVRWEKAADITINGKRQRLPRWEVDINGTSRPHILTLCARHGFIVDPSLKADVDPLVDGLRKHPKAAWLMLDARGAPLHAVLDLHRPDPTFSSAMKTRLKGAFRCDPDDDWNWTVKWNRSTAPVLMSIADEFGFACDPAMRR